MDLQPDGCQRVIWAGAACTHNSNSVIVDVCAFVQFLFNFSVLPLRPASIMVSTDSKGRRGDCSLNTARVESGLVHVVGNHG